MPFAKWLEWQISIGVKAMLIDTLREISKELGSLPSRKDTLTKCITQKLNNSKELYQHQIRKAYEYLLMRDNLKVVKTLARESKKKKTGV